MLIILTAVTCALLFGCSADWHVKRAMKKNPSMFSDTTVVFNEVKDTIVYETEKDTVLFDSTLAKYVELVNQLKSVHHDTTIIVHDKEIRNNYMYRIDKGKTAELERLIQQTRERLLNGFAKDTSIYISDSLYSFELHIKDGIISTNFQTNERKATVKTVLEPQSLMMRFVTENWGFLSFLLLILLVFFLLRRRSKKD